MKIYLRYLSYFRFLVSLRSLEMTVLRVARHIVRNDSVASRILLYCFTVISSEDLSESRNLKNYFITQIL